MSDSKIDILAINKSKLDDTINDHEVYIPGFEIVQLDRQINGRKGGGVCFFLRIDLNFKVRKEPMIDKIKCLTVEISKTHSRHFLSVPAINSPPDLLNEFENLIGKIDGSNWELYLYR